jgi:hypothetical protein
MGRDREEGRKGIGKEERGPRVVFLARGRKRVN